MFYSKLRETGLQRERKWFKESQIECESSTGKIVEIFCSGISTYRRLSPRRDPGNEVELEGCAQTQFEIVIARK